MNPLSWIKSGCDAVTALFMWATGRSTLRNSQAMQDNAAAETRQKIADQATKDVASGDLDQIRKDASES